MGQLSEYDIVLGSQFLREYHLTLDHQVSRLGLSPKHSIWCEPQQPEHIITLNDSANVRLGVNVTLMAIILTISFKVTGGCL